jgi:hypothetical protein
MAARTMQDHTYFPPIQAVAVPASASAPAHKHTVPSQTNVGPMPMSLLKKK